MAFMNYFLNIDNLKHDKLHWLVWNYYDKKNVDILISAHDAFLVITLIYGNANICLMGAIKRKDTK